MMVCGACRGIRFTGAEIQELHQLSDQTATQFERLDAVYKSLSPKARKHKGQAVPEMDSGYYVAPLARDVLANDASDDSSSVADEVRKYHECASVYVAIYTKLLRAITAKHAILAQLSN